MKRGEARPLPMLPRPAQPAAPPLRRVQHACYEALTLALKEGHVFAALTGPEGSGKTTVLEAVLADRQDRALRCIRISDPDKVPAALAAQIEQVAYAEADKPENLERHVVLAIDDAHMASDELLLCLMRLAEMREPGRRVPQVLLAGRPELWTRLGEPEYEPLARRLAIRAALPAAEDDADPWASVENEVTKTMAQFHEGEILPALPDDMEPLLDREMRFEPEFGFNAQQAEAATPWPETFHEEDVPPPSMFALFPDPPPKASTAGRDTRRRLVMPLVSLFVGLAAFAFALSFYDWPDLFDQLPWAEQKPAKPFVMPQLAMQAPSFGLPQPPRTSPAPSAAPAAAPAPVDSASPVTAPIVAPPAAEPPAPERQATAAPDRAPEPPVAAVKPAAPASAETPIRPEPAVEAPQPRPTPAPAPTPVLQAPAPTSTLPASPMATTPAPAPPSPTVSAAASPIAASVAVAPAARARAAAEPALSPAVMALLLRRGDEENAIGDISAARLLYERAAESGSGLAARQLARTYDPAFLAPAVESALADVAKARHWYQRAAALGNGEASARLKALNQGR